MKYNTPFQLINNRICDSIGEEVRLWGVNYYAPFHHNYANLSEIGVDHCRAIDRDIADFKKMGINFVRMHMFDREITDADGNIVENHHMEVFDYLIERLYQEGIYVMLTPIVWYNTVENEITLEKGYAYWDLSQNRSFGFSNFYPKHAMIWYEDALRCEENYYTQLFTRKNRFSGKTLGEYEHLAAVEAINEPDYPYPRVIRKLQAEYEMNLKNPLAKANTALIDRYREFLNGEPDTDTAAHRFYVGLLKTYLNRIYPLLGRLTNGRVLRSHSCYDALNPDVTALLNDAPIECISVNGYAPIAFTTMYSDERNMLADIRRVCDNYTRYDCLKKGRIAYEFNYQSTLKAYPLAALGYAMAARGVQMASYFTYTPRDLGAYNPGWIVHYLNLYHTPSRAASFTAGGKLFRNTPYPAPIPESDTQWEDSQTLIDAVHDRVVYRDGETYISSGDTDIASDGLPSHIMAVGSNPYAQSDGNCCYFIDRQSENEVEVEVLPHQWYVSDPFRGRDFKAMCNRYVNCNREVVVSRLAERGKPFRLTYGDFTEPSFIADTGKYRFSQSAEPTLQKEVTP